MTSSTLGANSEVNINLNSNSLKSAITSYLGISVYDLILSTSENGTNLSAYNFAPTEPLVNYDYFLLKLYARSEEVGAKTIYILATNTISLSAENITISVAETSNDAIISALNEDFEYVNVTSSTLYAMENGRAVEMAGNTLGEGKTSVTKQVYYIANTDGKTEHKLINLTINIESEEEGA